MNLHTRIEINPAVCGGKPVIRGTRVSVAIVVGGLAAGMSFDDVSREYDLSDDDIRAALGYASERLSDESHTRCLHARHEVFA